MQQSIENSTSGPKTGINLTKLKTSLWPNIRSREVGIGSGGTLGGSFKRLGESASGGYSANKVYSPPGLTNSMPGEGANSIRITTDLQQTDIVAPRIGDQLGNGLEW